MSDDFRLGIQIPEPDINESGEFFAALADHTCNALVAAGIPAETAAEAPKPSAAKNSTSPNSPPPSPAG